MALLSDQPHRLGQGVEVVVQGGHPGTARGEVETAGTAEGAAGAGNDNGLPTEAHVAGG